ncbi:hypothetical protein HD806DRAFT_520395 [Xylariaceae sp. AK1471]|nr:hypothetical protein HD806DRAFT_520395 [Xylariaceae sp. AK1471]
MSPSRTNPQPLRGKERSAYPTQLPPAFWDNLSEVPITKNALRELERRKPRRPGTQPNTAQCLSYYSPTARERIKRFARIGVHRKRGSTSASESTPTLPPTSTSKTGPHDRAFQQLLIDYGIYPNKYEYPDGQALPPPGNLEEIIQAIGKPQPSLSISRLNQEDFKRFERADAHALKEAQVMSTVIPIIEGDVKDGRSLDRQVRMQLNKHIVPSTQHDLPIVLNFFLNVKGPDGTLAVAGRQACYDGALGARGMNSLQRYSDPELDADNKAYTLTSTYYGGQLKIYATYPLSRAGLGMRREYAMTQIDTYALTGNIDNFRIGVSAYRNARDWAKRKRDKAIERANEKAARDKRGTLPSSSHCNFYTATVIADKDVDRVRGGAMGSSRQTRGVVPTATYLPNP